MVFFCIECGVECKDNFKFCPRCGTNLTQAKSAAFGGGARFSEGKLPANQVPPGSSSATWNLSGQVPFSLTARIRTTEEKGAIAAKCFPSGLWKNGGEGGQGKMLFLRGGVVCFDIGWVGCVVGKTRVSDGRDHQVGVKFEGGKYKVLVDGCVDGVGLHAVPDHPETVINIGRKIGHRVGSDDMAPDFSGNLANVEYRGPAAKVEDDWSEVVVPVATAVGTEAISLRSLNLYGSTCTVDGCNTRTSGVTPRELGGAIDLAPSGVASQSTDHSQGMNASQAIRGNFASRKGFQSAGSYSHTASRDDLPFWEVKLQKESTCQEVHVYGRPGYGRRLTGVKVVFLDSSRSPLFEKIVENSERREAFKLKPTPPIAGVRIVRLEKVNPHAGGDEKTFNINAVQVFGSEQLVAAAVANTAVIESRRKVP